MNLTPWKKLWLIFAVWTTLSCQSNRNMTADLILDQKARLGEGAIWHPDENRFYWIDIENGLVHIFDPATGDNQTVSVVERVGTVVPDSQGNALVALESGIYHLNLRTAKKTLLAAPEQGIRGNRFNDGKCDPAGRLWAGTMTMENKKGAGGLYQLDLDGAVRRMKGQVTISNGICWSLDHKTMYYIDTPTGMVEAFDYQVASGTISNSREVIRVPEEMGYPDGSTIDEEGMIWIALWGGGMVGRWDPKTGQLLQKIEVDALNVTSCAFGGPDLATLYITTAREGLDEAQLDRYPKSGGVFAVDPGVKGVPAFLYEGHPRELVWSDEFNYSGLPIENKWNYDEGGDGWGNQELEFYTKERLENARVEDSRLIIEARKEPNSGKEYTSARLKTHGKGDWSYGRFDIRAKLPAGRGTWSAIWMLPTLERLVWPQDGEIDIMEHVGHKEGLIHGTIHTQAFNHRLGTQKVDTIRLVDATTEFHVYSIEWTNDKLEWFVDGQTYHTVSSQNSNPDEWPFFKDFYLILNVAVGGTWGGAEGVDDSIWPQRMEVDWVRVYAPIEES